MISPWGGMMGAAAKALGAGLRNDWPALLVFAVTWVASVIALSANGINPFRWQSYANNLQAYSFWFALYLVYRMARVTIVERPEFPVRHFIRRFHAENWPGRLMANLPLIVALVVFMPMFSAMKSAIPVFSDYSWDPVFIQWDRALHGTDPWQLLQPWLGYPAITATLSALYTAWVLLIYIGNLYFCFFARSEAVRQQYFLAYFFAWGLLGIIAAQQFSTLGPCFLHIITDDQTFTLQMLYLHLANEQVPIVSVNIQEILVRAYYARNYELGSGISAMPSMHVALCMLFFLGMCRQSRKLAVVFGIYTVIVLVSSVHLAFHYAVDGYASIIGVVLLWWVAGRILRILGHPSVASGAGSSVSGPTPVPGRSPGRPA